VIAYSSRVLVCKLVRGARLAFQLRLRRRLKLLFLWTGPNFIIAVSLLPAIERATSLLGRKKKWNEAPGLARLLDLRYLQARAREQEGEGAREKDADDQ
jgi:hypothetical protein